jgi:hypothetical protein
MNDQFSTELIKALVAGGYNAAPAARLRQGSLHLWVDDGKGGVRPGTDEEHDAVYDQMERERYARRNIQAQLRAFRETFIVYASDCSPCEACGDPVCPRCDIHYAECDCPGPHSEGA